MTSTIKLLSEVAVMASGGTPDRKNKKYWNGDIPWVTTAEVSQYQYILDTKEKITELGLQNSSAKLFPEDSILLALYGQGKTRGKVALLGISATTNQACLAIQPDNTILKTKYLYYYLENSYEKLRKMANSGGQDNLSMAILKEFPISFPDLSTQEYRINLFDKLSLKIQLQQEKIDLLKAQKQGFLQKMFPKANATHPAMRFNGYTDDWKQLKFGEIIEERREKTKIEDEDILLSSAISGMYLNSELFTHFRGTSNIGYLKVKKNDLILSAQNLHLGNCNVNRRFEHGIISPAYKVYSLVNVNPDFIHAWLKKDSTKQFFERATTEGASVCRKNIDWNTLYNQKIYIPNQDEQRKIGEFFNKIDDAIINQQKKLELLQIQKQAFMQQMFI